MWGGLKLRRFRLSVVGATCVAAAAFTFAVLPAGASEPIVAFGPSDAGSVAVFSGIPGYKNAFWWDHSNVTVEVRAAQNVDPVKVSAIRDAIRVWSETLSSRLPQVSLKDVTGSKAVTADIVLRYVPHAGGIQMGRCRQLRRAKVSQRHHPFGHP
jgi:hypothetical protein